MSTSVSWKVSGVVMAIRHCTVDGLNRDMSTPPALLRYMKRFTLPRIGMQIMTAISNSMQLAKITSVASSSTVHVFLFLFSFPSFLPSFFKTHDTFGPLRSVTSSMNSLAPLCSVLLDCCLVKRTATPINFIVAPSSGVGSNLQVGGRMPARSPGRKFFGVPPHFSLVPPT